VMVLAISVAAFAQEPKLSPQQNTEVQIAFDTANKLLEKNKPGEALVQYKKALAILPKDPALLFNGGMAAFACKDFNTALDLWKQLKAVDPLDWHVRTKLIQTYQALGKTTERDAERTELFGMWKKGEPAELKQAVEYCREQFEDTTNSIWRETTKPTPKDGERLFHLDGYFKGGGHATYGMFAPEPTYDDVRARVIKILEEKSKP